MPVTYEYNKQETVVVVTCEGDVKSEDIIAINQEIHQEGMLIPLSFYILDLSQAGSVDVSAGKLQYLAEQLDYALELGANLKIAVVADHVVINSLIHMWHTYLDTGNESFRHFLKLEEALAWSAPHLPDSNIVKISSAN